MSDDLAYRLKLTATDVEAIEWALALSVANAKELRAVDPALMAVMMPRVKGAQLRLTYIEDIRSAGASTNRTPGVARQQATRWLADFVGRSGPLPWSEISWAGQQLGYADVTMRRVRSNVLKKSGRGNNIVWSLLYAPK